MRSATVLFSVYLLALSASGAGSAWAQPKRVAELLGAAPSLEPELLGAPSKASPQRIVTLAPSVTEILFALDEGRRVVGVSRFDDFPPAATTLPRVGGFVDPSLEAVVALRPDLVVAVPNPGNRPTLDRLVKLGIRVLLVPGSGLQDVVASTRAIARALGPESARRAEALLERITRDLEAVQQRVRDRKPPRVAFVYGDQPLILAGPGSFADAILAVINAENVVKTSGPYPQLSLERLVTLSPEVILDASDVHGSSSAPWMRFPSIPAVKDHRVHTVPAADILRPGPRIAEGADRIAVLVHGP